MSYYDLQTKELGEMVQGAFDGSKERIRRYTDPAWSAQECQHAADRIEELAAELREIAKERT